MGTDDKGAALNFGPAPVIANPLQYQVAHGTNAAGIQIVVLTLKQGQLTAQLELTADDMEGMGKQLLDHASQARSSLIIPAGAMPPPNGKGI
jgi:hypothetical protein